jgi:4-amino-4-deoxy-L-arabinose transferase-like glycosyltransferase
MNADVSLAKGLLENRRTVWVISAIILCFFVLTNLPWQLDDYDQALQAYSSLEMVKEGHWLFQRTPHGFIAQKPPLVGWLSAASFAVTRSWDLAWRLPSFLAAVLLAIILFRTALTAYGSAPALVALSAFGLNLLTVRLSTLVRTDMPLALFLFFPGLLIWEKIHARAPWNTRDRWVMFALFAASMLIKGPMNFAFLLPGIALYQWLVAKRSGTSAWCGWWPWLASLAVIAAWAIGGIKLIPRFYELVVAKEFLGRFSTKVHRPQPVLFYLPHLLQKFAPWSILIPAFAIVSFRRAQQSVRSFVRETSPETLWLVCWTLGALLVMSLVPSKRVDRIYPLVPPLCLLLAAQVSGLLRKEDVAGRVLRWSAAAVLFAIVFSGSYTMAKMISNYRDGADNLAVFGRTVRDEATAHHWRFDVISGRGPGYDVMLLYLRKLYFTPPDEAIQHWKAGSLDALVIAKDKVPEVLPQLQNASDVSFRSVDRKSDSRVGYALVTRQN